MRHVFAIDPGVNYSGWAHFEDGVLQRCGHDPNLNVAELLPYNPGNFLLVIERPRTYGGKSAKGDTMDLLDLSCEVGFFCGVAHARGHAFKVQFPQDWKGQTPKNVTHNQLSRTLTTEEWERVPRLAKKYIHNVLDAIAIGCRHLDRKMIQLGADVL